MWNGPLRLLDLGGPMIWQFQSAGYNRTTLLGKLYMLDPSHHQDLPATEWRRVG